MDIKRTAQTKILVDLGEVIAGGVINYVDSKISPHFISSEIEIYRRCVDFCVNLSNIAVVAAVNAALAIERYYFSC